MLPTHIEYLLAYHKKDTHIKGLSSLEGTGDASSADVSGLFMKVAAMHGGDVYVKGSIWHLNGPWSETESGHK